MIQVHILRSGTVLVPPFPAPMIATMLHAKSILPDDLFWHEGMTQWERVDSRWTPVARETTPTAVTSPNHPSPTDTTAGIKPAAVAKLSRWDRVSILQFSEKRYRETAAPFGSPSPQA